MLILVAGAGGLIGSALVKELVADGHQVRALVRRPVAEGRAEYSWDPRAGVVPAEAVEWADAVVNLGGASMGRLPWTARYRQEILMSRVSGTATLARAIAASAAPPRVWLNGSAVGIYGNRPGEDLTEDSPRGAGFLADVVDQWEAATAPARDATRVVVVRTGVVVTPGGSLSPLITATKLGLGATLGDGRGYMPWISLRDETAAIRHLIERSQLDGPVNLVGPTPATSEQVTRAFARALHRPHLLRLPAWLLRIPLGAAADDLLLADQRVLADRLIGDGFVHADALVGPAIETLLGRSRAA